MRTVTNVELVNSFFLAARSPAVFCVFGGSIAASVRCTSPLERRRETVLRPARAEKLTGTIFPSIKKMILKLHGSWFLGSWTNLVVVYKREKLMYAKLWNIFKILLRVVFFIGTLGKCSWYSRVPRNTLWETPFYYFQSNNFFSN